MTPAASGETGLEGTPWALVAGVTVEGWQAVAPSLTFADGRIAGSTGCNRYTAAATVDAEALAIGPTAVTQRACAPPVDAVERAFLSALATVRAWRVEDGRLILLDDRGREGLRFEVATPHGDWVLTGLLREDAFASPLAGATVTATFSADGRLHGRAGCNAYTTRFAVDRGTLAVEPPASTRMTCAEPAGVMEQETAFLDALARVASFQLGGGLLELLDADGIRVATLGSAESG